MVRRTNRWFSVATAVVLLVTAAASCSSADSETTAAETTEAETTEAETTETERTEAETTEADVTVAVPRIDVDSAVDLDVELPDPVVCPASTVEVATADELHAALADAEPGDVIELADGTYSGNFATTVDGTEQEPIHLCGVAAAVLDAGGIKEEYVLHLDGASWWRVVGITVRNGQKGVMADGVDHVVLQGLTVERTGDEAIHLRGHSSDNVVRDSVVRDTGHRRDKFGEGIYVGTAESNWCTITDCEPDNSDRNMIIGNTISDTTSESVDIKEGTTGGVVVGNTFDGSSLSGADSWVDVKGNGWLISANVGVASPVDGFQTHEILDGWGVGNTFVGNQGSGLDLGGDGDDDEGALIGLHPDRESIVGCDNVVSDASAPVSNVDGCAD